MIKSNNSYNLHPLLKKVPGNKILDHRWRTRIDEKYIPQEFNHRIVFQSFGSFQQNNKNLGNKIRKFVALNIKTETINSIGGESYLYDIKKTGKFYTNSRCIYQDSIYNEHKNSYCVDYNKDIINILPIDTVINLAKLNFNIMKQLNNSSSNRLIIINCHHQDFWKKIKLLSNYKLIIRRKFIDYDSKYFITVNILIRKSFVSLGGNCAVTYQLNKLKLRNKAYPFDWSQIKINKIIDAFESNFNNFTKVSVEKYSENHQSYLVSNPYGKFAHEVLRDKDITSFTSQLERRIVRLKEIKNPTFVRIETYNFKDITSYQNYWIKLCKIFDTMYDNYQIILISKFNPKLDKIKWYHYNSFDSDWTNDKLNWFNIFNL